jgi:hypothetical protein
MSQPKDQFIYAVVFASEDKAKFDAFHRSFPEIKAYEWADSIPAEKLESLDYFKNLGVAMAYAFHRVFKPKEVHHDVPLSRL